MKIVVAGVVVIAYCCCYCYGICEHDLSHYFFRSTDCPLNYPMSSGASEWASERTRERSRALERAKQEVRSKRMSERCERTSERTGEWPSSLSIDFIVILPTVHSLLRSLVRPHHSLIRLLPTACFSRALRCAHSFLRSLTHSLRSTWERDLCLWSKCVIFKLMMRPTDGRMDRWMVGQPNGEKAMFYQWTNQPINQRTDKRSDI